MAKKSINLNKIVKFSGFLNGTIYVFLNMLLMKNIKRVNIMCNNSNSNTSCNCIAEILKVINILDGMFRHVVEKQYLYMIFEES